MELIQSAAAEEEVTFLGTDINEDGGKAILVAGAPVARDGDEGAPSASGPCNGGCSQQRLTFISV